MSMLFHCPFQISQSFQLLLLHANQCQVDAQLIQLVEKVGLFQEFIFIP